jgi:hypothetical protein
MLSKRFRGAAMMGGIVTLALFGCGDDENNPLCCNEFKAGAAIEANIGGTASAQTAVQAIADFSGIASAAVDDLTTACRSMSEDLGAAQADRDAAEAKTGPDRMKAYCSLAVTAIGQAKAQVGGTLTIKAAPPKCSASIQASASCEAKCTGGAKCDFKANPPKCTGGTLEVSCKGKCTADASVKATVKCEGKCTANCEGSCTAQGGVRCNGKCEGSCTAQGSASGQAFDASGNCVGTCNGTCSVTPPGVQCSGSCNGECSGSCEASGEASASVKCDGKCDADFEPLQCTGGKLEGGCEVKAECKGNCDASVKAKAECTPPSVEITFAGSASGDAAIAAAGRLQATLKANFGVVLAFKSRLEGMVEVAGTITGNASAVADIKAACIPPVLAAGVKAVENVRASAAVTVDIAGAVGSS